MQLTLPSRDEPVGKLVLEQGAQSGRYYRFETSVCGNPVCQCEHVTLHLLADGPETDQPNAANRPVLAKLELDLAKRRVRDPKALETNAAAAAMAKAMVGEMMERDWDSLQRLYIGLSTTPNMPIWIPSKPSSRRKPPKG